MNNKKTTYADRLDTFIDNDIIDLFDADDQSIKDIAKEIFGDTDGLVSSTKTLIESAIEEGGRLRAQKNKDELSQRTQADDTNILHWSRNQKLDLLQKVSNEVELTKAARNRTAATTIEIDEDLEDLIDLGIIDQNGNLL